MSFDGGMALFKSAQYRAAAEQFALVTEEDENNHKAWNALGICLSKVGNYDQAATCFDNAVTLAPDNATYKKNRAGNEKKRVKDDDLELDDTPEPVQRKSVPASVHRPAWQYAVGVVGIFLC